MKSIASKNFPSGGGGAVADGGGGVVLNGKARKLRGSNKPLIRSSGYFLPKGEGKESANFFTSKRSSL